MYKLLLDRVGIRDKTYMKYMHHFSLFKTDFNFKCNYFIDVY